MIITGDVIDVIVHLQTAASLKPTLIHSSNNATLYNYLNKMDQLNEVVKYILYRCRENNTPITEIMANFIAQTVYNQRTQPPT